MSDELATLAAKYRATFKMEVDEDDPDDTPEAVNALMVEYIEALEQDAESTRAILATTLDRLGITERLRATIEREHPDTLVLNALEKCGAVIGPMVGGGFAFEDAEGEWDGRRHATWRKAALEALRYEGGEASALADRLELLDYTTEATR